MLTTQPSYFYTKKQTQLIQQALKALGKENLVLIIHGSCFPKGTETDTGFGSPYGKDADQFYGFIQSLGFNGVQLGPGGKTKSVDRSPYTGTLFSGNPLFIDFFKLLENPAFQEIIPVKELKNIVTQKPQDIEKDRIVYDYIYQAQQTFIDTCFRNFKNTSQNNASLELKQLKVSYEQFQSENHHWLFQDSLYEALSQIHGTDYWPHWKSEVDRNLLTDEVDSKTREQRINEVMNEAGDCFESYQFAQFMLATLKQTTVEVCNQSQFKLIADHQVAFSDRDQWANQSSFLPGYLLGAPPDYFSKSGQAWGFPVLHPQMIFDEDGELLKGGLFLRDLFKKVFQENPGGVRIDHIIGLIDPWVYPKGTCPKSEEGASRLFSSPDHHDLCHYTRVWHEDINWDVPADDEDRVKNLAEHQLKRYAEIVGLITKTAQEAGADLSGIICEDLGTLTKPVKTVLASQKLSGIRITQFVDPDVTEHIYRGKNIEEKHWVMTGSHDNQPLLLWIDSLKKAQKEVHARILAEDLVPQDVTEEEQNTLFNQLMQDKEALFDYKLAELFASPAQHIQIFFADLFGIPKYYNRPGLAGRDSWTLRLPGDYRALYQNNLSQKTAINLPHILSIAMRSKDESFRSEHQALIEALEKLSKV